MRRVRLLTRDAHFVADVAVPEFNPAPEALAWGARVFVRHTDSEYREGMMWVVQDTYTK